MLKKSLALIVFWGFTIYGLSPVAHAQNNNFEDQFTAEKVLQLLVKIGPIEDMGKGVDGHRFNYPIVGGTFEGKDLSGVVVPGGADFAIEREDGILLVNALYRIKTNDGQIIIIENNGIWKLTESGKAQVEAGKTLKPHHYYGFTHPRFFTSPGEHDWLQDYIFFGTIDDTGKDDEVLIKVFKLDKKPKN